MKPTHVYVCEDSLEGIFTAIYQAWSSNYGHKYNRIQLQEVNEIELFCEYINVKTDSEIGLKVGSSIKRKISTYSYRCVYHTAMSNDVEKGNIIYQYLVLGFHLGRKVQDYLSEDVVNRVFQLDRKVNNEVMHYRGFVRFTEIEQGILLAKYRPENNISSILATHFFSRYPNENWILYDESRGIAIVHPKRQPWFQVKLDGLLDEKLRESSMEDEYQNIWKVFVDHVSIKERENRELQRNHLPYRYREFMPEFQKGENKNVESRSLD